jgi:hypothetical protein
MRRLPLMHRLALFLYHSGSRIISNSILWEEIGAFLDSLELRPKYLPDISHESHNPNDGCVYCLRGK